MEHTGNGAFSHGSPRNYKSTARKEERPYLLRTQAWIVTILTFFYIYIYILTVYIRKYYLYAQNVHKSVVNWVGILGNQPVGSLHQTPESGASFPSCVSIIFPIFYSALRFQPKDIFLGCICKTTRLYLYFLILATFLRGNIWILTQGKKLQVEYAHFNPLGRTSFLMLKQLTFSEDNNGAK